MQIEMIPINDVTEYATNPRRNEAAVGAVAESIKTFGFKVPIIIDRENVIVAGHTRVNLHQQTQSRPSEGRYSNARSSL